MAEPAPNPDRPLHDNEEPESAPPQRGKWAEYADLDGWSSPVDVIKSKLDSMRRDDPSDTLRSANPAAFETHQPGLYCTHKFGERC